MQVDSYQQLKLKGCRLYQYFPEGHFQRQPTKRMRKDKVYCQTQNLAHRPPRQT